jgi:hypothetical protein
VYLIPTHVSSSLPAKSGMKKCQLYNNQGPGDQMAGFLGLFSWENHDQPSNLAVFPQVSNKHKKYLIA